MRDLKGYFWDLVFKHHPDWFEEDDSEWADEDDEEDDELGDDPNQEGVGRGDPTNRTT